MGSNPAAPTIYFLVSLLAIVAASLSPAPAATLRCAAIGRSDILWPGVQGGWEGIVPRLCQTIQRENPTRFSGVALVPLAAPHLLAAAHADIAVLTAAERGAATVEIGPVVATLVEAVMLPAAARSFADLHDISICVEPGTETEQVLIANFAARHEPLHLSPFQETEEMLDAFLSGRCPAIAAERGWLSVTAAALPGGPASYRILPEELGRVALRAYLPAGSAVSPAMLARAVTSFSDRAPAFPIPARPAANK